MQEIRILGVKFHSTSLKEAVNLSIRWAKGVKKCQIITPNPEMVLEAQKNEKFYRTINSADLCIPDGIGILWASKYLRITKNNSLPIKFLKLIYSLVAVVIKPSYVKSEITERVTGIDLMLQICEKSQKDGLKIFLLGAGNGVAEKTASILKKKFPKIKISGTHAGTPSKKHQREIIQKINKSGAQILFVAYGAPAQELWIKNNYKLLKTVRLAIGVGGSFNFITGIRKRAPHFIQKLGLEWLYRLIQEPKRLKRIFNATIKFPFKVFTSAS